MTEKISNNAVALDVVTGKKDYVPPQIVVMQLERQTSLLTMSNIGGTAGWGSTFSDDGDEWSE